MTETVAGARPDVRESGAGGSGRAVARARVPKRRLLPGLAAACSALVALVWISAGVRSAGRGLNMDDDAFYLISYRWWDVHHRNFTGAQYFYGPVFELLGYDIAGLRLFRLATIVAVHAVLGWSLMWWLRPQRPAAPATRLWEAAGTAAVVATGGVACGWFPLSPGYNDGALLGALLCMSFVLFAAGHLDRGRTVPLRLAVGYGATVPFMLLAKWSSVLVVLLTAAVAVMLFGRRPIRESVRMIAAVAAGTAAVTALLWVFVPVATAIREMARTNQLISASSGVSLSGRIIRYGQELYDLLTITLDRHSLLLIAAVAVVTASWLPALRMAAGAFAVVALGLTIQTVIVGDAVRGGAGNATAYGRTLFVALLVTVWLALLVVDSERVRRARWLAGQAPGEFAGRAPGELAGRAPGEAGSPTVSSMTASGPRRWLVLVALVLLPLAQAAGTTGSLLPRSIGGFAAWMAVMIAVCTGLEAASGPVRAMAGAVLVVTVVASGNIAVGGLWKHPYRTYPYAGATERAAGVPALASLRFNPVTAAAFAELRRQLRPLVEPAGRAMIGVPAVVLALDGRPVGEPWPRPVGVAAGIHQACEDGRPWWGSRPPLLLYGEPVGRLEIEAFRTCGITFATDYRLLASYRLPAEPKKAIELRVFVPTAEFTEVPGYPRADR